VLSSSCHLSRLWTLNLLHNISRCHVTFTATLFLHITNFISHGSTSKSKHDGNIKKKVKVDADVGENAVWVVFAAVDIPFHILHGFICIAIINYSTKVML
jgi:hypothetical protein